MTPCDDTHVCANCGAVVPVMKFEYDFTNTAAAAEHATVYSIYPLNTTGAAPLPSISPFRMHPMTSNGDPS